MQDATQNCYFLETAQEPLGLELNSTFPVEHVSELKVLAEPVYLLAIDKCGNIQRQI